MTVPVGGVSRDTAPDPVVDVPTIIHLRLCCLFFWNAVYIYFYLTGCEL